MSPHGELTLHAGSAVQAPAQHEEQGGMMSIIARAVSDPTFDVDKLEKLLAMKERMDAQQRQSEFNAALGRVHNAMPRINKDGRITIPAKDNRAASSSKFARLEDIDTAIRPLLREEGFSLSFDTAWLEGRVMVSGKLSHVNGHSETKQIPLPLDVSGSKNNVQGVGSTVSYGRRYLVKMFFNIIETEEDNDGNGATDKPITEDQSRTINDLIAEVGADMGRFKKHFGVERLADIRVSQLKAVHSMLETKRQGRR